MSPEFPNSRNELIQAADSFGRRFTHFEWKYLCSYQWYLDGVALALESNDFSSLLVKAEMALAAGHLRGSVRALEDELSLCRSSDWYE
jgi:hypothetical protein